MLLSINKNSRKGTSLVESMLAILIITIVALGGAAFIFFSSARVNMERTKRIALEKANTRLEEVRSAGFSVVEPTVFGCLENYLDDSCDIEKQSDDTWILGNNEVININGIMFPIATKVQYVDDDDPGRINSLPPDPPYGYIEVTVSVVYKEHPSDSTLDLKVTFTTYIQSLG